MPLSVFEELYSEAHGLTYFSLVPSESDLLPPSALTRDITSFLHGEMDVSRRLTGVFSADITDRDDVIVAVLSLLLVLAIEGVVTAFLLQTRNGSASNFGFSVNQFAHLAREFKLKPIFGGILNRMSNGKKRLNHRLIFVAIIVFTVSFGLEVLVLFLTNPNQREVHNDVVTFRIADPVSPDFDMVFDDAATLINPPCVAVSLRGVVQGNTRISACMSSDLPGNTIESFENVTEPVDVEIRSDFHEFGTEHYINLGEVSAMFSSRAYFKLGKRSEDLKGGGGRLMRKSDMSAPREATIAAVHKQYVAYLFTQYRNKTKDESMNLERLNGIDFSFERSSGPMADIIVMNEAKRILQRPTRRYTTRFRAVVPRGQAALRFARPHLKASTAVAVSGPNSRDLEMGSGSTIVSMGVVWLEEFRSLNWLSLSVVLLFVLIILMLLRWSLKPVVMAEMAGLYVAETIGASGDMAPIDLRSGDDHFSIAFRPGATGSREEWDDAGNRLRRRQGMGVSDSATSDESLRRL